MEKLVFLFPGQGSQYVGMGLDIASAYPEAAEVFAEADKVLKLALRDVCWDGPQECLSQTEITQPAMLTTCVAILRVLQSRGIKPVATGGLSLGEYPALVAAGSLDFATAVHLVRQRGRLMQEAVPPGKGAVAAVLGLATALVEQACASFKEGVVAVANYNCPGQVVVAGESLAVDAVMRRCGELGAKRAIRLPVSAPFHTKLLHGAGEELRWHLNRARIARPEIPVVSNVSADYYSDNDPRELLVKQVSHPVRFEGCMRKLLSDGYTNFVEIGPGTTLASFIKKIDKQAVVHSVGDIASLTKFLEVMA